MNKVSNIIYSFVHIIRSKSRDWYECLCKEIGGDKTKQEQQCMQQNSECDTRQIVYGCHITMASVAVDVHHDPNGLG